MNLINLEGLLKRFNQEKELSEDLFDREVGHSCGIEEIFVEDSPQDIECYKNALDFGKAFLQMDNPISLDLLNIAHGILMIDHPEADPGKVRKIQVRIGRHLPPPPDQVLDQYKELIKFINDDRINKYLKVAWAHAFFELVHPYVDGNGRIGRILITLLLWRENLVRFDRIIPISEELFYFRSDYYKKLSSARKDYENYRHFRKSLDELSWVKFFLKGMEKQLKTTLSARKQRETFPNPNHFKNLQYINIVKSLELNKKFS